MVSVKTSHRTVSGGLQGLMDRVQALSRVNKLYVGIPLRASLCWVIVGSVSFRVWAFCAQFSIFSRIKGKGGKTNPLIDTGALRKAIVYVVRSD